MVCFWYGEPGRHRYRPVTFQAGQGNAVLSQKRLMRNVLPAIIIAISACSSNTHEIWVATAATPVYASESDTEAKILFTLAVGSTCTPLRSVVMKAYLHTEIECKSGRGWTIDKQNFDIRTASQA